MDLKEIKKINKDLTEAVVKEVEYMYSRTDDYMEEQLILQTKLANLLILMRTENDREG